LTARWAREGNGRTQRAFLDQSSDGAGHPIVWPDGVEERNIVASRASLRGDSTGLGALIAEGLQRAVQRGGEAEGARSGEGTPPGAALTEEERNAWRRCAGGAARRRFRTSSTPPPRRVVGSKDPSRPAGCVGEGGRSAGWRRRQRWVSGSAGTVPTQRALRSGVRRIVTGGRSGGVTCGCGLRRFVRVRRHRVSGRWALARSCGCVQSGAVEFGGGPAAGLEAR